MNILVCVKQVPDTTEIKIDPVKNTLIRDGVPSIVNPFDGYALEAAARIKDKNPDTKIVVLSMGPPQATAALKECLAIAADKAYLVSGRTFGGSDTLATSYILYNAVKKVEELEGAKFDAIFCGKQAIDGDTAQVGPELAEHLGYPQVTYGLEAEVDGDMLKVKKEVGGDRREVPLPGHLHQARLGPPLPHHQAEDGRQQGGDPRSGRRRFPRHRHHPHRPEGLPHQREEDLRAPEENRRREDRGRGQRGVRQEAVRAAHCGQHHLREGKHNGSQDQGPVGIC